MGLDENVASAAAQTGAVMRVHLEDLEDVRKATIFSAADAVLVPFTAAVAVEPPLTLMEAMACGAPVVVSPQANRSALVRANETGLIFDGAGELAARLEELAAMGRDGRRLLGERARRSIARTHGSAAAGEALGDVWTGAGC